MKMKSWGRQDLFLAKNCRRTYGLTLEPSDKDRFLELLGIACNYKTLPTGFCAIGRLDELHFLLKIVGGRFRQLTRTSEDRKISAGLPARILNCSHSNKEINNDPSQKRRSFSPKCGIRK